MRSFGRMFALFAFAGGTVSCATTPPAIPVGGSSERLAALAGTWNGDYSNPTMGRFGSIRFTLAVNSDTAFGDVTMQPKRERSRNVSVTEGKPAVAPPAPPPPVLLKIAFVEAMGDTVAGLLDPYHDPECSCTLLTRFEGRLRGNRITGRFSTRNLDTGQVTWGDWNVRRRQ